MQPRPQGAFPWLSTSSARENRPGDEIGRMNRELKQRRRGRQRERQKSNRFD